MNELQSQVRPMRKTDLAQVKSLSIHDRVSNAFIESRLWEMQYETFNLHEEILVFESDQEIQSALYHGANTIPLETNLISQKAFAQYLIQAKRRSSSLVGPVNEVLALWKLLKPHWGIARDIRANQ
ncbi:MAG: DUF4081 domain-containing protein, partial [Candidatus Nanopelagicales bacterium]